MAHVEPIAYASEFAASSERTRRVALGPHSMERLVGGDSNLFRHQHAFESKTLFAVSVTADTFDETWARLQDIDYKRMGEHVYVEALNLVYEGDVDAYVRLAEKAAETGRVLILQCFDTAVVRAALAVCSDAHPLVNGVDGDNLDDFAALAAKAGIALGVHATSLDGFSELVASLNGKGCSNLALDVGGSSAADAFSRLVKMRRSIADGGDARLRYPTIVNVAEWASGDLRAQVALAALFTCKYASIVVLEDLTYAEVLPLYGLRQGVFSDPERPMRVEPGVYSLNGADTNAVCCTTVDFAMTYYMVAGELERSGVPVNMVVTDSGGYSLLTAWAMGKFTADTIADYFNANGLADSMQNKTLILPGKVAALKDELESKMPDWEIVVGPAEAADLVKFVKAYQ